MSTVQSSVESLVSELWSTKISDLSLAAEARRFVDRAKADPAQGLAEAQKWCESNDPDRVSAGLWARGAALYELGRNDESIDDLERALTVGSDLLNARIAISLAAAESASGRLSDAVDRLLVLIDGGISPSAEAGTSDDSGESAMIALVAKAQLGMIRLHEGRVHDGCALLDESIVELEGVPDEQVVLARAIANRGLGCLFLGEVRTAERLYRRASALAAEHDQLLMVAAIDNNLAYVRMCLGDLPAAIASYRQALDTFRSVDGSARGIAVVCDDLAEAYRLAGLTGDAVDYARQSVVNARAGSNVETLADALHRYAQCLYAHGEMDAAATAGAEAAELFTSNNRILWATRSELVRCAADAARSAAADQSSGVDDQLGGVNRLVQIANRLDELGASGEAVTARNLAASLCIDAGNPDEARRLLEDAGDPGLGEAASDHTLHILERLYSRLLLARLRDDPIDPILSEAHTRLSNLFGGLADPEMRNGAASLSSRFRAVALDLALAAPLDPWEVMQTDEAWRFPELSGVVGVDLDAEEDEISENLGLLRLLKRQRRRKTDVDEDHERRIGELEREIRELSFAASASATIEDTPVAPVAIRPWLAGSGALVVQLFEHRGDVHAVSVSVDGASHRVVGPVHALRADLDRMRRSLGRILRSQSNAPTVEMRWDALRSDGRELGRRIFGKASPGRPIVVSCPSGLAAVPWSLLLGESCLVSVVASASTWPADAPTITFGSVAVVVGPDLDHAIADGRSVLAALPQAVVLADVDAGCDDLLGVLQTNDIVHVAAHSYFRPDSVMFSSLQMHDGLVPVYELARLKRSPQLVVLAACEAGGTGGSGFGEWLGLVPELLRSGSECLVAPIRPIADVDAAAVMAAFYRNLRGNSVAGALAAARLELADESPRLQAAAHAFLAFGRGNAIVE